MSKHKFISWLLVYLILFFSSDYLFIFEIYPQREVPLLTEISKFDWFSHEEKFHLLPDTLILRVFHEDRIGFSVVDYRTNYSTCFSVDVDLTKIVVAIRDGDGVFMFS